MPLDNNYGKVFPRTCVVAEEFSSGGTLVRHWCLCHNHAEEHRWFYMHQDACCNRRKSEESSLRWADFPWCGQLVLNYNVCNKCFCWYLKLYKGFWCRVGSVAYEQLLIVARVWREYGNRFFKYEKFFFKLSVAFLKFFYLLCSEDLAIIRFNGWVLFNPTAKSSHGYTVFFTQCCLGFASGLIKVTRVRLKSSSYRVPVLPVDMSKYLLFGVYLIIMYSYFWCPLF